MVKFKVEALASVKIRRVDQLEKLFREEVETVNMYKNKIYKFNDDDELECVL